jgi:hypothetical protein
MPDHPVIVPPDSEAPKYGSTAGLRARLKAVQDYFEIGDGKLTGLDYNMWVEFRMNKADFLATMKYTLEIRLRGNRAPFMYGGHSDIYSSRYTEATLPLAERRAAIAEFLQYALGKPEVRVVPLKKILEWVRNPVPLD